MDRNLNRLASILSTPAGQDNLLATAGYTLQFLHANLNTLLATQLQHLASKVVKSTQDVLAPGETLIASLPAPKLATLVAGLSSSSKGLADLIADHRIFVRLWGLLGIYQRGKSVVFDPPADKVLLRISLAQVGANVLFQALENLAYLGQHAVIRRSEKQQFRDWVWSSRFWGLHVALEFARLARLRMIWDREPVGSEDKEGKARRREEVDAWWRELLINICYAPLTVHWSVKRGILRDGWIGFLGAVAGGVALGDAWRKTA